MQTFSILPKWLTIALITGVVVSFFTVSGLAAMTAYAYVQRPFNPASSTDGLEVLLVEANQDLEPIAVADVSGTAIPQPAVVIEQNEIEELIVAAEATLAASNRVTVLLMGIDRRPGEAFISRTDTMMILSVNPDDDTASILSVPRDLYVEIPGYGRNRINTAFVYGANEGGPAGGAQLAMETVELNLGVHIDHYVLVDFGAFIKAIDTIGGISVYVPRELYDAQFPDMNYGYDPFYVPAGTQQFDGLTALKYARTRHVDNDFGRAQRQQQVVLAVRQKVLALGLNDFLTRLPVLYQQMQEGIRTDLSISDMVTLISATGDIPEESIRSAVIDYTYVTSYRTPQGSDVLVLQNELVGTLIEEMFAE
jgi:LCP family protein required for cell wall assembly